MQQTSKDDAEPEKQSSQQGSKMSPTTRIAGDIFFFTITMALFAVTLAATLYRSYLPQGLSPPFP